MSTEWTAYTGGRVMALATQISMIWVEAGNLVINQIVNIQKVVWRTHGLSLCCMQNMRLMLGDGNGKEFFNLKLIVNHESKILSHVRSKNDISL